MRSPAPIFGIGAGLMLILLIGSAVAIPNPSQKPREETCQMDETTIKSVAAAVAKRVQRHYNQEQPEHISATAIEATIKHELAFCGAAAHQKAPDMRAVWNAEWVRAQALKQEEDRQYQRQRLELRREYALEIYRKVDWPETALFEEIAKSAFRGADAFLAAEAENG